MLSFPLAPERGARLLLEARRRVLGGAGSGNFGHAGRPGEVGGSAPGGPVDTSSANFKKWFGNSKVVDENGEPLVVYKGMYPYDWTNETPEGKGPLIESIGRTTEFPAFHHGEKGVQVAGFFGDRETAGEFAEKMNGAVYPVYLSIQKPYVIDAKGDFAGNTQFGAKGIAFREAIRSGKYDGVIIRNTKDEGTVYVALKPTQIKSAISNTGAFDPKSKLITMASAESPLHAAADAHVAKLSVAFRYAFAVGRRAIKGQLRVAGGPGSGNFGHAGRPGQVGGSAPGGFADDISESYPIVNQMRAYDERDAKRVRSQLRQQGRLNEDGTVSLYHATVSDPASITERGLIPAFETAPGQDWEAVHAGYATYFFLDKDHAIDQIEQSGVGAVIEARIPITGETLSRFIPDEDSSSDLHDGVKMLLGAGNVGFIGGVPAAAVKVVHEKKWRKLGAAPKRPLRAATQATAAMKKALAATLPPMLAKIVAAGGQVALDGLRLKALGGPGSGNFGHAGRPGQVGGSAKSARDSFSVPEDFKLADAQYDVNTRIPTDRMVVADVDLDLLTNPYPTDWRVREMAKAIEAGVQFPPITIDQYPDRLVVVDGNTRVAALKELGLTGSVPAVIRLYGDDSPLPKGVAVDEKRTARLRSNMKTLESPLRMRFDARNPAVVAWAKRHAGELITAILTTTLERIRLASEEFQDDGDWDFYHDRIMAAVGDEARADLIARHETMLAANEGQRQGWGQAVEAGLLAKDAQRVWITTPDERLCPVCEPLEGKTATLDGEYDDGIEGPPAHVQCRCTEGIQ